MTTPPSTLREAEWQEVLTATMNSQAIMVTDVTGIIVWVNEAFTRLTGFTLEEVIGQNPRILKSGAQEAVFYKELWQAISHGKTWTGELINKRKDGSQFLERMIITPLLSKEGELTHYVAMKTDVTPSDTDSQQKALLESVVPLMTELKDVTTALEQARSEMQAMLNATSEGMTLLSPEDELLWYNQAFQGLFALTSEEAVGRNFNKLENHWKKVFEDYSLNISTLKEDKDKKLTLSQIWPQKREVEVYSAPVENTHNEYLGQLLVFRDVTREREVERMKTEFVSLVSHEFRTPLTSIRGYTEMMLDGDTGELSDDQTEFLNTIFRNATHLSELVNDLLEVSKLEAGSIKLSLTPLDITPLIDDSVDRLRPLIQGKKQKIDVTIKEKLPMIVGDSQRITQVLMNLISNAHKYTPEGGTISLEAKVDKKFLRISIKDTGIGMSKEELEKLFTKFFRVKNPATIKSGGTGLGLWITRSLVEMHGGEISVTSRPGKGSTFIFTLPIK